jgi:4-hydroxy-tetrahydrodipicolinate reductase
MGNEIRVGVHGAAGRMGRRIVELVYRDKELIVAAALESSGCPLLGRDAGELAGLGQIGLPVSDSLGDHVDVIIDFSVPDAAARIAETCGERRIALVCATTGLSPQHRETILTASQTAPVIIAPNCSLAVNILMKLVREAARALKSVPEGVDVEIVERHHRHKEDAPSGTALRFGEIVAEEMGQTEHVHGRHGRPGPRPTQQIGYHALRLGDVVGEHTVSFGMAGELLELTIRSQSRESYALGAIQAAKFLVTQHAGLYSMSDVLGL